MLLRGDPSLVVRARIRLPASPCLHHICCFRYSTTFIYASHPLMRSIHSCATLTYALYSFPSIHVLPCHVCATFVHVSLLRRSCVALIHASPSSCVAIILVSRSLMRHLCSCVALIHVLRSLMRHLYSCVALIHVSHSLMRHLCSCVTLIYLSHLFILRTYFMLHTRSTIHLFMRCIHSRIAPSMRYVASLLSCISHAACSLLTPFFSLTCIKSQTSWRECSATIKMDTWADVHKIHCWPTQLLFSLVPDSLNVYSCQSIFHICCNPVVDVYLDSLPQSTRVASISIMLLSNLTDAVFLSTCG